MSAPSPSNDLWKPVGDGHWVGTDPAERFPVYTRGNAGEVYPEVFTPLSFSIAAQAGEEAMRSAILYSGLIRPEEIEGHPLSTAFGSGVFGGYAYLNLSIQRVAAGRVPGGKPTDADVSFLGVGDPPPHVVHPDDKNLKAGLAGLRFVWKTINDSGAEMGAKLAADQRTVDQFLADMPPVDDSTNDELHAGATERLIDLFAPLFETHLKVSFVAGLTVNVLTNLCEKQLDDPNVAVQLLAGLGEVDSAAPSVAIWKLGRLVAASDVLTARFDGGIDQAMLDDLRAGTDDVEQAFVTAFDGFLANFGSRGPNEWDTAFDTWETDPLLPLVLIDRMRLADESHDPTAQQARLRADREQLEAEVLGKLKFPVKKIFQRTLNAARTYSQFRERSKTTVVRAIHGSRLRSMELDRRLVEQAMSDGNADAARGDLWFLTEDEIDDYMADPAGSAETIAGRRAQHAKINERIPPFFFETSQPPLDEWELRSETKEQVTKGEVLTGLPGCLGVARGRARVVTNPADPRGLEPGDVLVAPLTDPSWTPLFVPAEAVVVDVGAVMSHAVIVSRELGIPCAVSVSDATRRIPDGALIEVDGSTGTVTVIELPE